MKFEQPKWVPWVSGGNSTAQDHARFVARSIILATAPPPPAAPAVQGEPLTELRAAAQEVVENHAVADGDPDLCVVHFRRLKRLAEALAAPEQAPPPP